MVQPLPDTHIEDSLGEDALGEAMAILGVRAREASRVLALSGDEARVAALRLGATRLRAASGNILAANDRDLERGRASGKLSTAFIERLTLNPDRVEAMARGLEAVAARPDPLARDLGEWTVPHNGLRIRRVAVPLGVVAVIYEARPNVTADAAAVCLRAGNAAILRGGSDSQDSATAILDAMKSAVQEAGLPPFALQAPPTADRAAVGHLLTMRDTIDVVVPRGGRSLVERVQREACVPVFAHLEGICHTYLHESADTDTATRLVVNAKMRRVSVCGACETLLVDSKGAARLLPPVLEALFQAGAEVRGCPLTQTLDARVLPATQGDWGCEFLAPVIACRVVADLDEAMAHIRRHGSAHTDAIIAEDNQAAERFLREVDSAIVMHNTSTQFADGAEFGLGAEIGIATGRLHARGPVGADQLTTFHYQVRGDGKGRD